MIPPRSSTTHGGQVGTHLPLQHRCGLTIRSTTATFPRPFRSRPARPTPGAVETLLYGKQELYVDDVLTFDGQDMSTFPVILDEHTGAPAQIRFAWWLTTWRTPPKC